MTEESHSIKIYEKALSTHGDSHRSLNWGSRDGQIRRFEVLSEIGNLRGRTVLDVGCGLGHLADWLDENRVSAEYTGIEVAHSLVQVARARRSQSEILEGSIFSPDVLKGRSFDYVLASGIFYTYAENGESLLQAAVGNMWKLCTVGVAFNSLSTWASDKEPNEFYANPIEVFSFARQFTPWVTLRHDYHSRDFTVYMKRERTSG